jgi:hypothetical protein
MRCRVEFQIQGNAYYSTSVRSGSSTTQVYDVTVSPGTPATSLRLYYSLEQMVSVFDLMVPVRSIPLVYTCT